MNDFVYLLKIVDPETGKVVEYKTFHDAERDFAYLMEKIKEDNYMYDHYIKRLGVSE